jgi:hypothetical protein
MGHRGETKHMFGLSRFVAARTDGTRGPLKRRESSKRSQKLAFVACAAALVTAACGSSSHSAATSPSTSTGSATTPTSAATTGSSNVVGQSVAAGAPIKIGIEPGGTGATSATEVSIYNAMLSYEQKQGQLPVFGRDIQLVTQAFDSTSTNRPTLERAACVSLAQDDHIFAALSFPWDASCLASFKIPAIATVRTDAAMTADWPYAFSLTGNYNEVYRNMAPWANSLGLLKGRVLGVYHGNDAGRQALIDQNFVPGFTKLGYKITEDIGGATQADVQVAVQKFKAAGVNTVFLYNQIGAFANYAASQDYHPTYILGSASEIGGTWDFGGGPAYVGMTAANFNGTYGLDNTLLGDDGVGTDPPVPAAGVACEQIIQQGTGLVAGLTGTPTEQALWVEEQAACDSVKALVTALHAAGANLTQGGLIKGLETIQGQKSGEFSDITFTPTNHFASALLRTVQFNGSCTCWKVVKENIPPWVP